MLSPLRVIEPHRAAFRLTITRLMPTRDTGPVGEPIALYRQLSISGMWVKAREVKSE